MPKYSSRVCVVLDVSKLLSVVATATIISFVVAFFTKSVVEFLKAEGIQSTIKWPNDIYVYDLKICGILVETILDPDLNGIIVGIGLNVNYAYPYLCMKDITQKRYDISQLLLQLIHYFNQNIELYQNHQFDDILKYTNLHAYLKNKWVHYKNYGFVRLSFLQNHD